MKRRKTEIRMRTKTISWVVIFLALSNPLSAESPLHNPDHANQMVVLIHGIMDRPFIMWHIQNRLLKEGYAVLNFDYASTKEVMDTVVQKLEQAIRPQIGNMDQIHFVTHSLGGLIIRAYLMRYSADNFGRLVMIAPPNKGSVLAERLEDFPVYEWLSGPAGQKLGKDANDYGAQYPPPSIPFGIIAGGLGNEQGFNPLIPGDDDGTVGVSETQLSTADDFILITGLHTTLLWQPSVSDQLVHFIKQGQFSHP